MARRRWTSTFLIRMADSNPDDLTVFDTYLAKATGKSGRMVLSLGLAQRLAG